MKNKVWIIGIILALFCFTGVPKSIAGDSGDPRDYQRDVERKLRNLERREYERTRDAERRYRRGDISPREHVQLQRRLDRQRNDDWRDYQEWRRDRDRDFYRAHERRFERYERDYVGPGFRYYDSERLPYTTGYRGDRGGFGIQTPRFSFYIDH